VTDDSIVEVEGRRVVDDAEAAAAAVAAAATAARADGVSEVAE